MTYFGLIWGRVGVAFWNSGHQCQFESHKKLILNDFNIYGDVQPVGIVSMTFQCLIYLRNLQVKFNPLLAYLGSFLKRPFVSSVDTALIKDQHNLECGLPFFASPGCATNVNLVVTRSGYSPSKYFWLLFTFFIFYLKFLYKTTCRDCNMYNVAHQ